MSINFDAEVRRRLPDTEDHFTERKESGHEHTIRETIVSFANSAVPGKPGIIYIGVTNKGAIKGLGNSEKTLKDVSSWAKSCFPPVAVISTVVKTDDGLEILAVVVPASDARPHFAKQGYKRVGSENFPLSLNEVDLWIDYRNSKVRLILDWKGKFVTVKSVVTSIPVRESVGAFRAIQAELISEGTYKVLDCNSHFVTLQRQGDLATITEFLNLVHLKMDDMEHRLFILVRG